MLSNDPLWRLCSVLYPLAVGVMLSGPAHAQADVIDVLGTASAERRVGYPQRALDALNNFPSFAADDLNVAAIIRVACLIELGRLEDADALMNSIERTDFELARRYLAFRLALARGAPEAILAAAPPLLARKDLNRLDREVTQFHFARTRLANDKGRQAKAVDALKRLSKSAKDRSIRAGSLRALSEIGDEAARRRLLIDFPATTAGRAVHGAGGLTLDGPALLRRALQLFEMRAYDLAEPDFKRIIAAGGPEARQQAQLKLATIRMRLRQKYPESVDLLKQAMTGPDGKLRESAQYRYGLALGYLGEFQKASQFMSAFIARASPGRRSVFARYQVGRLLHEADLFDEALIAHRAFLATNPPDRDMWIWFEGWTEFRKGAFEDAISTFNKIAASRNVLVGAKALYWIARAHQARDEAAQSKGALEKLEARAGISYYGNLGRLLSAELPPRAFKRQRPMDAPSKLPHLNRLTKAMQRRVNQVFRYAQTGFIRLARGIYTASGLRQKIRRRLGKKRGQHLNDALDLWLEQWGPRWGRLTKKTRRLPWREGFAKVSVATATKAFPPAYLKLAEAAGRPYAVSPWWLLSHMLQESRYRERATSHAIAMGPMQIIPRTGRIIADRIGFPRGEFLDEALFLPGVALRQAAWYLSALRDEYSGNVQLAMAAYNGGPLRMTQHLSLRGPMPFDALIEEVGAHETRNYVRKVSDHLLRYVELYGSDAERKAVHTMLKPPVMRPRALMKIRF
ncbi:MAG: transglycosylase SLT domain-containing protein [Myxococcota bacterium]|nr:transglycosylase SLT domain-containing protein [Myxococcota bacterium]